MRTALVAAGAAWGMTGLSGLAQAAQVCSVEALNGLSIADLKVVEAKSVAAGGGNPSYCDVLGTVVTKGAGVGDGLARFSMKLPENWQQRFLFLGVGGNTGNLIPAANATDRATALGKGYAVVLTDTGHIGDGTSAKWTVGPDGKPDMPKRADFFHRAAHSVTIAGKALVQAYYSEKIEHAYFDGCSTGGRMGLMEAMRYPEDFDGIISGDPMMDFHTYTGRTVVQKAILSSPASYIPEQLLAALDARVTAMCDAKDGTTDGLIQNPAACHIQAEDLQCKPGEKDACVTPEQARVLRSFTSQFVDAKGHEIFTPWAITNLSGVQGTAYTVTGKVAPDTTDQAHAYKANPDAAARSYNLVQEMVSYWLGFGPEAKITDMDVDPRTNTVGENFLELMNSTYAEGITRDPERLKTFIAQGRKLIMYHGASDPSIPASRSIRFYREFIEQQKGVAAAQSSARLFLVPGMHHCSGGIGPDQFDTLSAIEAWLEKGSAPDQIVASTKPGSAVPYRLPLCPFPSQARYLGHGEMTNAGNWRCEAAKEQQN